MQTPTCTMTTAKRLVPRQIPELLLFILGVVSQTMMFTVKWIAGTTLAPSILKWHSTT
jgi:hypothetical protein